MAKSYAQRARESNLSNNLPNVQIGQTFAQRAANSKLSESLPNVQSPMPKATPPEPMPMSIDPAIPEAQRRQREIEDFMHSDKYLWAVSGMGPIPKTQERLDAMKEQASTAKTQADTDSYDYKMQMLDLPQSYESMYGIDINNDGDAATQYQQNLKDEIADDYKPYNDLKADAAEYQKLLLKYNASSLEDRAQELLSAEEWTDEDKAAAEAMLKEFEGNGWQNVLLGWTQNTDKYYDKAGYLSQLQMDATKSGDYADQETANYAAYLRNSLYSRLHSVQGAIGMGLFEGTGANSLATLATEGMKKAFSNNEDAVSALDYGMGAAQAQNALLAQEQPGVYGASSVAGTLAALLSGNEVLGAGAAAIKGFSALPKIAQGAILAGTNFGIQSATHNAGAASTGQISGGAYAKDIGISALGGAVGSVASTLTSAGIASLLSKYGLQTAFGEFVRQVTAGTAFAGGDLAVTYPLMEEKPTGKDIAINLGTAFLFSAITGGFSTMKTTAANKARLQKSVAQMEQDYKTMSSGTATAEEIVASADKMLKYSQDVRTAISQNYYAGQQEYINNTLKALDALDELVLAQKTTAEATIVPPTFPGAAPATKPAAPSTMLPVNASDIAPTAQTTPVIPPPVTTTAQPQQQSYIEKALEDTFYKAGQAQLPLSSIVSAGDTITDAQQAAYDKGLREATEQMREENAKQAASESVEVEASIKPVETPAENQVTIETAEQKVDNGAVNKPQHEQIANTVYKYISKGQSFTADKLFEIADKAYGGTMAAGSYTVKDAYDAMELAVNKYLEKAAVTLNGTAADAVKAVKKLQEVISKLPTQTKRTAEMEEYQQFSTPPNIAYLAAWSAGITSGDTVLEPSAGIGGLAVFPKAWGANVYVNELSPRRLEVLKSMGFEQTFNHNAEQIDNLLPDDVKPSVVLMNPPFSSAAGRMSTKATANAKRHIEQALNRLESNGRLVAILGRGMADSSPSFKDWWAGLKEEYNIRANIQIDGKNYKKYGTNFDIQLVVIDKTGPTDKTLTGTYDDLTAIPKVLEGIRNDRARTKIGTDNSTEQDAAVTGRERAGTGAVRNGALSDRGTAGSSKPVSVNSSGRSGITQGNGKDTGVSAINGIQSETGIQPTDGNGRRGGKRSVSAVGNTAPESQQRRETDAVTGRSDVDTDGERIQLNAKQADNQRLDAHKISENSDSVYSAYTPKKLSIKGAKPHPAKLVESAAMAAVDPPDITYTPNLPQELVSSGALSIAQLENIVYAGQSHAQMLKNGMRRGYFIGDGTGVGKGRQVAGIILDNMRQGRTKAVWISKNNSLTEDARRDWIDIGGSKDDIVELGKVKLSQKISADRGILFSTFSTIKTEKADGSRIKQIEEWLGKDFDGVIVFDEAHNMSNSTAQNGKRGKQKAAAKALAGIKLQDTFPNARIVYASATGATKISDYAYLTRLGLWGEGTAFHDVNDFIEKISAGGLAAMELVARDMKAMGVYMARNISYDDVTYDTITHSLTPVQREIYDTMSRAWQKVLQNIDKVLNVTSANLNSQAKSSARSQFYGAMQRFYNQIITSMSMPSVIEDIKKELAKDNSVVIQLVNTNQAAMERRLDEMSDNQSLDELDLTPSDTLKQFLETSFPIYEYEEYEDEKGNKLSRLVTDGEGKPVISREAVRIRDDLIADLSEMKVPDGPLEMLFDVFGVEQVAEVTGRTRRIVPKKDESGSVKRILESRTTHAALADAQLFQDGKKRILVFSDAGGTGKSYHADRRAKNQQKRIHYLLQPGWNASNATQGFGRTHRSNQASAPTFRLVTTDIMGQKRFTSTIARRLDQLGALTKGQRQAGSGVFSQKDNLESDIARDGLARFYRSIPADSLKKMGLYDKMYDQYGRWQPDENTIRDMGLFLNRILSLEVDEQNRIFGGFYTAFESSLDQAIAAGTLDMGLENVVADKIEVKDEKSLRKYEGGAETKYVQMKAYRKPQLMTYAQIEDYLPNFKGLVRMENGEVRAVYQMANKTTTAGDIVEQYRLQSPVLDIKSSYIKKTYDEKTTPISKKEWSSAWKEQTAKAPEYVEQNLHLLTGTLLPIWNRLPAENTRVMRVITSDGRQYLGRLIRADQIDDVLKVFGIGRTKETFSPDAIYTKVLDEGYTAVLEGDRQRIERRRVSGEYRIEITGNNTFYYRNIPGVIIETINYNRRYFVPTNEQGVAIIKRIVETNPVVEMTKSAQTEDGDSDGNRYLRSTGDTDNSETFKMGAYSAERLETLHLKPNNVIIKNNEMLSGYVREALEEPDTKKSLHLGAIPQNVVERIKAEIRQIKPEKIPELFKENREYSLEIGQEDVRHIKKPGMTAEQVIEYVGKLPDIVTEFDGVTYTTYYSTNGLRFEKTLPDGKYYAVELISKKQNVLATLTMFQEKSAYEKKKHAAPLSSALSPEHTSETSRGSASSTQNVAQQDETVKYAYERPGWGPVPRADTADNIRSVMSLANMMNKMRHDFGITISTGKIRRPNAAGVYHEKAGTIRTKIANDLPSVAHELGHHFDALYGLSGVKGDLLGEIKENLPSEFEALYKDKELPGEGVAEFVRRYLSDRVQAESDYPQFYPHFTQALSNEEMTLLDGFANEVYNYLHADLKKVSSAAVSVPGDSRDFRTVGERVADKADVVYQAMVDSNHGIRRFTKFADDKTSYILATNSAYADSVASANIMYGLTDLKGKRVGPGLKQALKGVNVRNKTEFRDFNEYLIVKHGPERLKEGMRVFADDRINNADYMNQRRLELERQYPQFPTVAQQIYTFNQQLLSTWAVNTGLVAPEVAAKWGERWKYYVPLNRVMDDNNAGPGAKRGYANQRSPYKKARGSGRDIIAPVESIARNATKLIQAAIRNNVMLEVTKSATATEGSGAFLEKVPAPISVTKYDAKDLKKRLKTELMQMEDYGGDPAVDAAFEIVNSTVDDILIQYGRGKAFGDTVTVMKNGKPEFWQINDPMLLESVTSMAPARMSAILNAYGRVTRFITSNITGNNIIWSIFSNMPRDFATFMTYSENKNPVTIIGNIAKAYVEKFKAYKGSEKVDPLYLEFMAMGGGGHNSLLTADRDMASRALDRLLSYNSKKYINPLEWIEVISDMIEGGPRFAYYRMRRKAGISPKQAFYDAMDLTTNFRRSGVVGREINKVIPFSNASVQGLDRFARWSTAEDVPKSSRKKAVAARWSFYAAAGIALALMQILSARHRDEDGYEQLSAYVKNNYWNIPLGDHKFFSIPKPRELGALTTAFERAMETYLLENPDAFAKFDEYITAQFLPPPLSGIAEALIGHAEGNNEKATAGWSEALGDLGIIGTGIAMLANKDFRGIPIVSKSLMYLEPRAQFNGRTSKIAIAVGDALNMSPIMIDYFLSGTLGGFWKIVRALLPNEATERDWLIGVGSSYVKDSRYSTDVVNDFYEQRDMADKLHKTYSDNAEYKIMANDYDDIATFYSRYNQLAKSSADTLENLQTRQMVIEMLEQFLNEQETGQTTSAKRALDKLSSSLMDTSFAPQVMAKELVLGEGADKKLYSLTAAQYVEYETVYLNYYWEEVQKRLYRSYGSDKEKAKAVNAGKATALDRAKQYMAKKLGLKY